MKKLMLAAAIVCAAVTAQAVALRLINIGTPSTFTVSSRCCDMYAYKTDPTQSQLVKNNLSWASFAPDTIVWDDFEFDPSDHFYWLFTYTLSDGSTKTLNTLDGGLRYDYSAPQTTLSNGLYASDWAMYTQNASNWREVPEPTSAMLMLLGVAGLALKRKQK